MVQEGEEASWMASQRVGETGLADSGPSTPAAFGIHGSSQASTKFFDQEGAAYFGGLEEALVMQGVDGLRETEDTKSAAFLQSRPATLEIFPSWPMRFQQTPTLEKETQSRRSIDSGSAQNAPSHLASESPSPASLRTCSDQSVDHKQEKEMEMMMMMMSTAPNPPPASQDKRRITSSTAAKDGKKLDAKTLRRLAQNREAARKSRLRKKAYVQQLESSRVKLQQIEHDLQRARSQGLFLGGSSNGGISSGAAMFDVEYGRWLEENGKHMADLRGALQAHLPDGNLSITLDECIASYDDLFRLKAAAARADVFHLLNGTWTTPAERCFLWMGGFRPSELLKILIPQLEPLTEQQFVGMCGLRQSSQQAEEALSQGLDQLHQSLADAVAGGSLSDTNVDVANYMAQMSAALGKLACLEGFLRQADNLRQQTIHQLRRTLTIRQAARCFLAIGEYFTRLRALSSFWSSRPRQNSNGHDSAVESSTTDLQIVHQQPLQNHFGTY